MVKITLGVEGMSCGMCEAHVNDAVRRAFPVKKVTSSQRHKQTVILAKEAIEEAELRRAIEATGYTVTSYTAEPYEKTGFSLFHRD